MQDFLRLAETEVNAAVVIMNILFVLVLELAIVWVYKRTHRGLSFSQSFITTIVLMGLISSIIMMVITENIVGAFALLGAFSLIRFRTIVKETRDIAFIFFALAVGVAGGTNNYTVAFIGTVLMLIIILALDKFNFGTAAKGGHMLIVMAKEMFDPGQDQSLNTYTSAYRTVHVKTLPNALREYTIGIKLKDENAITSFVNALEKNQYVESMEVISGRDAIEY